MTGFQKIMTQFLIKSKSRTSIPINCFVRKIISICINSAVHIGLQQFKHSPASISFHVHKRVMLFNMLNVSWFVCVYLKNTEVQQLLQNNFYVFNIGMRCFIIVKKKPLILSLHLQTSTIPSQQFE